MSLKLWEIDDGEQHWFVAESREEALELHLAPLRSPKTGEVAEDQLGCVVDEIEVTEVPLEQMFRVGQDDGTVVAKTVAEWCLGGKGFVATTAY